MPPRAAAITTMRTRLEPGIYCLLGKECESGGGTSTSGHRPPQAPHESPQPAPRCGRTRGAPTRPSLVVLVGAPRAGKTHWAGGWFQADQIVSSDRLRAIVGRGERDAFEVVDLIVDKRRRRAGSRR